MDEWTHKLNVACRHCCSPPPLLPSDFFGGYAACHGNSYPLLDIYVSSSFATWGGVYVKYIFTIYIHTRPELWMWTISASSFSLSPSAIAFCVWLIELAILFPPFSHESVFALICERTTYGRMPPFPSRHTPLVRTLSKQSKSEEGPFELRAGLVHLLSLCAPFLDGPVQVLKERERSYLTSFFLFSRHENSTTFCQHIHQHLDGRISVCIYKKKKVGQPCRKFDYHPKKTGRFLLLFQLDPHCDCNPFVVGCFSFRREDLNFWKWIHFHSLFNRLQYISWILVCVCV